MARFPIKFRDPLILNNNAAMKVCEGCDHLGKAGFAMICQYILDTGHRRPCPAGAECTVNTTLKGENEMKKRSWDEARARQLHAEGLSDLDIADMVGASEGAIRAWRARNRLHSNTNPRKSQQRKEPAAAAPSPTPEELEVPGERPAVDPPEQEDPAEESLLTREKVYEQLFSAPVEISFSCAGCNVTLAAPNHQSALWAAAYLNDIVDSLVPERESRCRRYEIIDSIIKKGESHE